MKQVTKPSDVPVGRHYAIIVYKTISVYIPGDERSRTNPGHGYPAHSDEYNVNEHYVTLDHAEWVREIEKLEDNRHKYHGSPYCAFIVEQTATVQVKTVIDIR